jgi:hypothetical protein
MKSTSSVVDLPNRSEVIEWLEALTCGRSRPDEASKWASHWLLADETPGVEVRVVDRPVWDAIVRLAGADLQTSPGSYVHGPDDFSDWLQALREAPRGIPGG